MMTSAASLILTIIVGAFTLIVGALWLIGEWKS